MIRNALIAYAAYLLIGGVASAAEIKGKLKSVDAEKNVITVLAEGNEQVIIVAKGAEVYTMGMATKKQPAQKMPVALSGLKVDDELTIMVESKDGKDVATAIQVGSATVTKKKKKTK